MATKRPSPFVILSTNHGTMIVNKNDYHSSGNGYFGVGFSLMHNSEHEWANVELSDFLLSKIREVSGDNVLAVDCGANIGCLTLTMAKHMHGWGTVLAFEPQRMLFYALAGNVAINNCMNAHVYNIAVGANCEEIVIPELDFYQPGSFGSLEIKEVKNPQDIGQPTDQKQISVKMITIDSLNLSRLDLLKIDVEGMEFEVLEGAKQTLEKYKPCMIVEYLKNDHQQLIRYLENMGYAIFVSGMDFICIHQSSPVLAFFNSQIQQMQKL
jgi:FkbM family methyltransferase